MYGPERTILGFCEALPDFDFQCTIGLIHRPLAGDPTVHPLRESAARLGIEYCEWDGNPTRTLSLVRQVREQIREAAFDVIHAHDYKSNWIALLATRNCNKRPGLISTPRHSEEARLLRMLQRIDTKLLPRFDLITEASTLAAERLKRNPAIASKVRIVEHGAGSTECGAPKDLPAHEGMPVVLLAGRLEAVKGHKTFLQAMRLVAQRVPSVKVWLAGEGSLRQELEELVKKLGLENRVHFLGYRADIGNVLYSANVAVVASTFETSCRVAMEALEYGCPLVATPVGIIPSLSDGGRAVLLTPIGDAASMATAVESVLSNPELADRLRSNGLAIIRNRDGHRPAAAAMAEVYREAIALAGLRR